MPATRRLPLVPPALAAALAAVLLVSGCGGDTAAPAATHGGSAAATSGGPSPAPEPPKPLARSVPVWLRIPGIGVDSPLSRLGLASDGTVQVPPIEADDPAGWYEGSPTPGQKGPSVILGHVTVGQYGDGVFARLARLKRGDRVEVRLQDGVTSVFTVDEKQTVAKSSFPTDAVYGDVDRPELRLITCGGPHSSQGGGYADNVIVYASLAATSR